MEYDEDRAGRIEAHKQMLRDDFEKHREQKEAKEMHLHQPTNNEYLQKYQENLLKIINTKTGWGRNELHTAIRTAEVETLRFYIDRNNAYMSDEMEKE